MAKHPNENLFEGSTMTFGEHLEELRGCLMRALIGLVIGTLLGLLVAKDVVRIIESPLKDSLADHYSKLAVDQLKELYGDDVDPALVSFVERTQLIFEEIYLEKSELVRVVPPHAAGGDPKNTAETSPESERERFQTLVELQRKQLPVPRPDMVKTRIWRAAEGKLTVLSPTEGFVIWMKAGFVTGLVLSCPYVFYQLWIFVAAGLYPHEKKYVYLYLPFSIGLFLTGACTAFFFVFKPVLNFLFSFNRMMDIDPDLRISEVISFILFLPLGFGIAFQLPLVMLFLHRIGIFSVEAYLEKWRIAVLVIFVISMLLTPADPYSMLLMAMPLTGLYALGILLCKWMPRSRNPFDEVYEP